MANTWTSLLTRYGFVTTQEGSKVNLESLTNENRKYLEMLLTEASVDFTSSSLTLEINDEVFSEDKWQALQGQFNDGVRGTQFEPNEIPVSLLDLYIVGLVMQFDRLGFVSQLSCDGHEKRPPHIYFKTGEISRKAKIFLDQFEIKSHRRGKALNILIDRKELPSLAEKLSKYQTDEVREIVITDDTRMSINEFNNQLETLLNIPGVSGRESKIRQHVYNEIYPYVNHISIDHYGNIIAEKRFSAGPTVLLNAHLDTVEEIESSRVIMKDKNVWTSNEGILGADDRAGVNVIVALLKSLQPNEFKGTLKIIFTVEEEIGLLGAREVNESFLWDVSMAFVIDRRGTNDIVTHNYSQEFCHTEFGRSLEGIARLNDLDKWGVVRGGSSDTSIWALQGIQSVNLSAGYLNEHTDSEQLDVKANYNTYLFVNEILRSSNRIWCEQRKREVIV